MVRCEVSVGGVAGSAAVQRCSILVREVCEGAYQEVLDSERSPPQWQPQEQVRGFHHPQESQFFHLIFIIIPQLDELWKINLIDVIMFVYTIYRGINSIIEAAIYISVEFVDPSSMSP